MNINTELNVLQNKLESAHGTKNPTEIVKALSDLIYYHQKNGDYAQCISYSKFLLSYNSTPEKQKELALNYWFIGGCHMVLEEYAQAEESYYNALRIYRDMNYDIGEAEVEVGIGILFRHKGQFDESLSHLIKGLEIYDNNKSLLESDEYHKQRLNWIEAVDCCGVIYGQMNQPEKSMQFFEHALELKHQYCHPASVCSTLMNMGVTFSKTDTDKAMDYYLQAYALMDDSTPMFRKAVLLNNLGGCLEDKGEYDKSIQYYNDALKMMETSGQMHYKASMLKSIGTVFYKKGHYQEALKYIEKSLNMAKKNHSRSEIKDCYLVLSDIYCAKQDFREALEYRVKYDDVKDEIFQQDIGSKLTELQKKYNETTMNLSTLKLEKSLITDELKKAMNMGFVGVSNSLKEVHRLALFAAGNKDTRVLITGESGVGKEIIARLIHYSDATNEGRFIDVNCCSIPETMAESEFFGYVRGAYTGAINSKAGFLEEADRGTLFLDEIGDMPMVLQSKLLRVLETKQIKRLGSNKPIAVNFRLVSATNKNISELISENNFRADLMYRINTIEIFIPPLRERKDDIEPLLEYYLAEYANRMNKAVPKYDRALINKLCDYSFPGNVRELRNMIERVMIFLKGNQLTIDDFTSQMASENQSSKPKEKVSAKMQNMEDNLLLEELKACGGNQLQAAKNLGISYSTFKRKYKKLRNI